MVTSSSSASAAAVTGPTPGSARTGCSAIHARSSSGLPSHAWLPGPRSALVQVESILAQTMVEAAPTETVIPTLWRTSSRTARATRDGWVPGSSASQASSIDSGSTITAWRPNTSSIWRETSW